MTYVRVMTGMLVRDPNGRTGIVFERRERPAEGWIKDQENVEAIRHLPRNTTWWSVLPLTGGLVIIPEPMLEVLRPAAYEDFLAAVDGANIAGRKYLALIFPEYVDRIITERQASGSK